MSQHYSKTDKYNSHIIFRAASKLLSAALIEVSDQNTVYFIPEVGQGALLLKHIYLA